MIARLGKLNIVAASMAGLFAWWALEPSPYSFIAVSIEDPVKAGSILNTSVTLTREKLCPYILERRIYAPENNKVFDERESFSTPSVVGTVSFIAPITTTSEMKIGGSLYQVRVGSMCNPVRKIFPLWSNWLSVKFTVSE